MADSENTVSPKPNRLFQIQELLCLISTFLSQGDAFRFARCSRICFQAAVGRIWESVSGSYQLFALLPGTFYIKAYERKTIIDLPDLSTCDFGRFDFYATFVRRLELFSGSDNPYTAIVDTISNWSSLISFALHKTLLPNLQYLVFNSELSTERLSWLMGFLSPSLLSIQDLAYAEETNIDTSLASELLEAIRLRCPGLEQLRLHPLLSPDSNQPSPSISAIGSIYEYFGSMQNLRILSTNIFFSDPSSLLALAKMQRLETLNITHAYYPRGPLPAIRLPNGSFPALRELTLPIFDLDEFKYVWSIQELVEPLVMVGASAVCLELAIDIKSVLSDIFRRSPKIVELELDLGEITDISFESFWPLEKLCLEKLLLDSIDFAPLETACEILADTCPSLRELVLPGVRVCVSDLQHLSRLSRLEHFHARIRWRTYIDIDESVSTVLPVSRSFRRLTGSQDIKGSIAPELIQKSVQFLLSFWPQLDSVEVLISTKLGYAFSTSNMIHQALRDEQVARRCRSTNCSGGVTESGPNLSR